MSYITEYSQLGIKEQRQLRFKRQFKQDHPAWDDSMVRLVDLLKKQVSKNTSVLDAGCGKHNFVIDELMRAGIIFDPAVGMDAEPTATAGNTSVKTFVYGNLEHIPLPDAHVDVVTSLWVLEHLEHPDAVFREIYRVLKPGGLFAFTTPNAGSLLIRLRKLFNQKIAEKIVYALYGRADEDTFAVRYCANRISVLKAQARKCGFAIETLNENVDPSYTSFEPMSYTLSRALALHGGSLFRPHIIGVWRKP